MPVSYKEEIYLLYIDCDDVGVAYERKYSGEQTPLLSSLPGKSVERLHNGQNFTTALKNTLKLVKLQGLVLKCCKM